MRKMCGRHGAFTREKRRENASLYTKEAPLCVTMPILRRKLVCL